ncbi:MAG: type II toxin-antitoxin system RelE/ParE family toxin [Pseudomonadota bacterium]|nr:type II toxin-antitoxin system RelE/ParE family toxin [Pseudomonadota bacterium]
MRRIVWADEALENLEAIGSYIRDFNPGASRRLTQRLVEVAESLAVFPDRGRAISATRRELPVVRPYLIRYAVTPDEVHILKIRHAARRPEP